MQDKNIPLDIIQTRDIQIVLKKIPTGLSERLKRLGVSNLTLMGDDVPQGGNHSRKGMLFGSCQMDLFSRQDLEHTLPAGIGRFVWEEADHQRAWSQAT